MKRFTNLLIIMGAVGLGVAIVLFLYYRTKLGNTLPPQDTASQTQTDTVAPFTNNQESESAQTATSASSNGEQTTQPGDVLDSLVAISDIPVRTYYPYTQKNIAAIVTDGKIISINGSQAAFLSTSKIENIQQTAFSFDGTKLAALFGDTENPQISIFDLQKKVWEVVHETGVTQISWSPSSYEFIYTKQENGNTVLGVYDAKNISKKPRIIGTFAFQDIQVRWQSPQYVLITEKPSAYTPTNAWAYNIQTKNLYTIETDKNGLEIVANNSMTRYIRLVVDEITKKKAQLSVINQETKTSKKLSFITLASKCSFENIPTTDLQSTSSTKPVFTELILCGIAHDQVNLQKRIIPDSYYKKSFSTIDDILAINPADGEITSVITNSDIPFDATNIHTKEGSVFFINRYDQKIYRAPLVLSTGD